MGKLSYLGYTNHSMYERAIDDFYSTDPIALKKLLNIIELTPKVWECACGNGVLSKILEEKYEVLSTDLIDRGYGTGGVDFLKCSEKFDGDIITNPPFKNFKEFVLKGLELSNRIILFGRLAVLETVDRKEINEKYLTSFYVFSKRINCYLNGDTNIKNGTVPFAWFVYEKVKDKDTVINWI